MKPNIFLFLVIILLTSCQSNQPIATPKNEVTNITFQDNVVHCDFEILELKGNLLLGKLVLSNLQPRRVSFNTSGIIFKNKDVKGKAFEQLRKSLTFKSDENNTKEMNEYDEELFHIVNKFPFQGQVTLEEDGEVSFVVKVEFEEKVSNVKDVKVMLNLFYKQLLSKN